MKNKVEAKKFIHDVLFVAACQKVDIEPSIRQARKFQNRRGLAYIGYVPASDCSFPKKSSKACYNRPVVKSTR